MGAGVKEEAGRYTIELLPGGQEEFFYTDAKYPGLFSGRGGGKTAVSVLKAGVKCIEHPGIWGVLTQPNYRKIHDVLMPKWRQFWGFLEGVAGGWVYRKGDEVIEWGNKSTVLLRSADSAELGRGPDLGFFGMDEAGESTTNGSQEEVFLLLMPALRQGGMPLQGWVTTTPRGQRHWLYQNWIKHETSTGAALEGEKFKAIFAETGANVHLPAEYIEDLKMRYGDTRLAEQELRGRFVILEGMGFPGFDPNVFVGYPEPGEEFVRYIGGLDWGVVSPTAIYEVGVKRAEGRERPRVHVLREFYKPHATLGEMAEWIRGTKTGLVFCDQTAKDCIRALNREGIMARKCASNSFHDRVTTFGSYLSVGADGQPNMKISPECKHLLAEIESLEFAGYKEDMAGTGSDRWARGVADHGFDAVCYALQQVGRHYGEPPKVDFVYL